VDRQTKDKKKRQSRHSPAAASLLDSTGQNLAVAVEDRHTKCSNWLENHVTDRFDAFGLKVPKTPSPSHVITDDDEFEMDQYSDFVPRRNRRDFYGREIEMDVPMFVEFNPEGSTEAHTPVLDTLQLHFKKHSHNWDSALSNLTILSKSVAKGNPVPKSVANGNEYGNRSDDRKSQEVQRWSAKQGHADQNGAAKSCNPGQNDAAKTGQADQHGAGKSEYERNRRKHKSSRRHHSHSHHDGHGHHEHRHKSRHKHGSSKHKHHRSHSKRSGSHVDAQQEFQFQVSEELCVQAPSDHS